MVSEKKPSLTLKYYNMVEGEPLKNSLQLFEYLALGNKTELETNICELSVEGVRSPRGRLRTEVDQCTI